MTATQLNTAIRRLIGKAFALLGDDTRFEAGATSTEPSAIRETILIDQGCYVGRRFVGGNCHAEWLTEAGRLEIQTADGLTISVAVIDVADDDQPRSATPDQPLRRAA